MAPNMHKRLQKCKLHINELCCDDVNAMEMTTAQGGFKKEIIIVSVFFLYDLINEPRRNSLR